MTLKVTDEEFKAAWHQNNGSATAVAKALQLHERGVHARRRRIEASEGKPLLSFDARSLDRHIKTPQGRVLMDLPDGVVLVGSDVHIWPCELTTAQRAFIAFAHKLKPAVIVINGDLFDGARVSRFPAGMWSMEHRPTVKQELDACLAFTKHLEAIRGAKRVWTMGNHDMRYEARLASLTPEYEGIAGFSLKDHWPEWKMCMSLWVNDLVIKHRWKGGIHAPHRNTIESGKSMCTGHLHSLKVMPWTDYNDTRYGVDCGTLAEPGSAQFDYVEDNPVNWRSGFAVFTFKGGKLLMPELVQVWDENSVQFRGEVIPV